MLQRHVLKLKKKMWTKEQIPLQVHLETFEMFERKCEETC